MATDPVGGAGSAEHASGAARPPVDLDEPYFRAVVQIADSVRRYLPLYAILAVFVLMMAVLPSVEPTSVEGGTGTAGQAAYGAGDPAATSDGGAASETAAAGASVAAGPTAPVLDSADGGASGGSAGSAASAAVAAVEVGAGVTRGGVECKQGVNQLPFSVYAMPCLNAYEGGNGGATWQGVTDTEVKIVMRTPADSTNDAALDTFQSQGAIVDPTSEEGQRALKVTVDYLNKMYELYGRKLVFVPYQGQGNGTEETQSRGKELACADATDIADRLKPFAVTGPGSFVTTGPFAECAAERKMLVPAGSSYYAEPFVSKFHPYIWNYIPACDLTARQMAEYVGKRLGQKPARWARDPIYQKTPRVYGIWVPENDAYAHCASLLEKELKEKYNIPVAITFKYTLDFSVVPAQSASAVTQFKAAGVTDLLLLTEGISPIFLTQHAKTQSWGPEWVMFGTALQDSDQLARLYDQDVIDGHYFGMSQIGTQGGNDSNSEPLIAWREAGMTEPPPGGYELLYYNLVYIFNFVQAAGPLLTPESWAAGIQAAPDRGTNTSFTGVWTFKGKHTAIDDSREVYWDRNATAADGKQGAFIPTHGGRRFRLGEWPAEDPPVYPDR